MLNIYQYFAEQAFSMVEETKPPPKGKKFPQAGDVSEDSLQLMEYVRDHYIAELDSLSDEMAVEVARKQFESLYAAGVFTIYADTHPNTWDTQMDLFVWDGVGYVPVQEIVDEYLCNVYDRTIL